MHKHYELLRSCLKVFTMLHEVQLSYFLEHVKHDAEHTKQLI